MSVHFSSTLYTTVPVQQALDRNGGVEMECGTVLNQWERSDALLLHIRGEKCSVKGGDGPIPHFCRYADIGLCRYCQYQDTYSAIYHPKMRVLVFNYRCEYRQYLVANTDTADTVK